MSCRSLFKVVIPAALLLCSVPAWAESRMALVIGQSAYKSVPVLPNPANDRVGQLPACSVATRPAEFLRPRIRSISQMHGNGLLLVEEPEAIDTSLPMFRQYLDLAAGMVASQGGDIFVGRITRQKGLPYLLRAAAQLAPEVQLVLCAGAPDTPEILAEVETLMDGLRARRDGVVWIPEMLPRGEVIALLSAATVFACPSVYEPLGIVNLEAMACGAAVVASDVGGIPEVVIAGVARLRGEFAGTRIVASDGANGEGPSSRPLRNGQSPRDPHNSGSSGAR